MNKAILMGRLTRDPEVRYGQNNMTICNYTLAVNRRFTKPGEERQADFIPIVTFGKTAEFCEKYFRKGQQVLVCGRIQVRSWEESDGKRRFMTEVVCDEVHFADSKRADGNYDGDAGNYGYDASFIGSGASSSSSMLPEGDEAPRRASTDANAADTGAKGSFNDGFSTAGGEGDLPF